MARRVGGLALLLLSACGGPVLLRDGEWGALETGRQVCVSAHKAWYKAFEVTSTVQVRVDFSVGDRESVGVALLTEEQARKFARVDPPEFICKEYAVQGRMTFIETVPPGRYVLDFDNRAGEAPVMVDYRLQVRPARLGTGSPAPAATANEPRVDRSIPQGIPPMEIARIGTFDMITRIHLISLLWSSRINLEEEERGTMTVYRVGQNDEKKAVYLLSDDAEKRKYRGLIGRKYFPGPADADFETVHLRESKEALLARPAFAETTLPGRVLRHRFVREELAAFPRVDLLRSRVREYVDFKESEKAKTKVMKAALELDVFAANDNGSAGFRFFFQAWDDGRQVIYVSGNSLTREELQGLATRYPAKSP